METKCLKCSKTWPASCHNANHCTVCHQTFSCESAGDAHRIGEYGNPENPRRCKDIQAGELGPWWQDKKGLWHHGKQLTEEQKQSIFRNRKA